MLHLEIISKLEIQKQYKEHMILFTQVHLLLTFDSICFGVCSVYVCMCVHLYVYVYFFTEPFEVTYM